LTDANGQNSVQIALIWLTHCLKIF
jgi:hypothetical protein